MLKEFLDLLGKTTGKTYSPAEFKAIVQEALDHKDVTEEKKEDKPSEKSKAGK